MGIVIMIKQSDDNDLILAIRFFNLRLSFFQKGSY